MQNIFDPQFSGMPHIDMYRSWVFPDLFPKEKQPLLRNWSADDIAMFVGAVKEVA